MKLSTYATEIGVSYKTAYRMFKRGELDAYQTAAGTIIVKTVKDKPTGVAIYCRVSSSARKEDLQRQGERLQTYCLNRGHKVDKIVLEVASGMNDKRPKLTKLLQDSTIGIIVVEHKERLARFGFNYIQTLLSEQGREVEVVFQNEIEDDLVQDFIAIITSMCARIYGRRGNKNRAAKIAECIKNANS